MLVTISIDEAELRNLIIQRIESLTGCEVDERKINILVKSKQNYKSEWECANFKAEYSTNR